MASPAFIDTGHASSRSASSGARELLHVAAFEWRWLMVVCCVLIGLSLLPLFVSAAAVSGDWAFMGSAHNYQDAATYLSKMRIGHEGGWLLQFMYTPEPHDGALTMTFYPFLGHLARLTGLDLIVVYHLARVINSLIMYFSLYLLGAVLWTQIGTRRLFFAIAAMGAGFGWFAAPLTGLFAFPDLAIPEIFPFYSSLVNPHFPLAIALLALLATQFVRIIRPNNDVAAGRSVLGTALLGLGLAVLYPQALIPFTGAVVIYLANLRLRDGTFPRSTLLHTAALIVPAVPMAVYLGLVMISNPAFAEWNRQNVTLSPPLWVMLAGLGIPLLLGLPAAVRAARRLDRDGDRLMLWWLLVIFFAMYSPTTIQRRFGVGLMIPVAFFATRALRDYWMPKLGQRTGRLLLAAALVMMTPSIALSTFVPVIPFLAGAPDQRTGIVLPVGYRAAMDWLDSHGQAGAVVMAAAEPGAWIPGMTSLRVVYGHPFETLNADVKLAEVTSWYGLPTGGDCRALLDKYSVDYVLFGPLEAALGSGACLADLTPVASYGSVGVYAVR